jgi:hypothetical protein
MKDELRENILSTSYALRRILISYQYILDYIYTHISVYTANPAPHLMVKLFHSRGIKRPGREFDHASRNSYRSLE